MMLQIIDERISKEHFFKDNLTTNKRKKSPHQNFS